MKKCLECGEGIGKYEDPRDPPLALSPCLCETCAIWIYKEKVLEATDAFEELTVAITNDKKK